MNSLVISLSTPTATPVLALGTSLPASIEGKPVYYRRKEIARAGHYVHRGTKEEFDITAERMALWLDSFNRRKAAGIQPFVPEKHVTKQADARDNFGYVVDLEREGESLYGTFQFIGEDALAASARNDVSIYVIPDAVDAKGGKYAECIEHVCLTPNPAIPHLQPFVSIAASADQPARDVPVFELAGNLPSQRSDEMDKELIKQLRAKFGWGNETPDEKIAELSAQKSLALSGDVQTLTTERDTLKSERDAAKEEARKHADKILALDASNKDPDALSMSLISRAFKTDRERVIESGVVSEAGMKEIDTLLMNEGKPTRAALALSGGSPDPFYSRLCDILRRNPGIKTNNGVPRGEPAKPLLEASADANKGKTFEEAAAAAVKSVYQQYAPPAVAAK